MEICLSRVNKHYPQANGPLTVLDDIQLTVSACEFVVLFGKSGSGKSTLLNIIGGLDLPSSGRVLFDGQDIVGMNELLRTLFRRKRTGFVFQAYNLIPTLTVTENLRLPLALATAAPESEQITRAREWLERLDLADKADAFPDALSGGEQQRVAIGRALIHEPDVILADEPTGNLDLSTAKQVLQLLDDRVRQAGRTLIMATHSREVIGIADRVLELRNGHLKPSPCKPLS